MYGTSPRDAAPQLPQYGTFAPPPANYWQGNQMMVPGQQDMGGLAGMMQGMTPQAPTADPAKKKDNSLASLLPLLGGGIFSLLPGLMGGENEKPNAGGIAGLAGGGLGGLIGQLFGK